MDKVAKMGISVTLFCPFWDNYDSKKSIYYLAGEKMMSVWDNAMKEKADSLMALAT